MSTADEIKGVIKEAAGRLTGDRRLQAEGKADKTKAKADQARQHLNETVDEAKAKAKDVVGKVAERLNGHH